MAEKKATAKGKKGERKESIEEWYKHSHWNDIPTTTPFKIIRPSNYELQQQAEKEKKTGKR